MEELEKNYNPKDFEDRIYKEWEDGGCFIPKKDKEKKFTVVMPPPNVTGVLHMGHALNNTLQDVVIRYKRMKGFRALWIPGTDHASISTEAKVTEKLGKQGMRKEELGREKFLEEAWKWTEEYGGNIVNQLKKLGVSCDWTRERFTLDEICSRAVREVFVDLYNKGLIYKGKRIINRCPDCDTALSDAEVEHEESHGHIWRVKYKIVGEDNFIEIETTRPETILGDLAIAVNPKDERFASFVGKKAIVPIVNREVPIIADEYVDMEFGSGAVKITPSHDPNDFIVGERHNLGHCLVIDGRAKICEGFGKYSGLYRYEARTEIIKDIENLGQLVGVKEHKNSVGHCERCHTVVEPLISEQWFVSMETMAKKALKEYTDGHIKFIPERLGKIYQNWLENIKDWCISRQLWWGHRIPVWYCEDCSEVIASKDTPKTCPKCKSVNLRQEEDTLDTWFSSALWPFSTLGWPEETEDYKTFFPTDILITGYDIIFFWVVRMVFSSLEQTGTLPFTEVMFNGLVRDDKGRKMSKSLGNGIDPLEIIEKYGADALRFTLLTGNSPGNDMRFYIERVESSRNFANKLWNAARFLLMNLSDNPFETFDKEKLKPEDKWIISRTNSLSKEICEKLDSYEIGMAADEILDFTWGDFCDWYIEMVKSRLFGEDVEDRKTVEAVLLFVLENILKFLHPFMPYITEEIWAHLPDRKSKLIISDYPEYSEDNNFSKEESEIAFIQKLIKAIRNIRMEMKVAGNRKSAEIFVSENPEVRKIISSNETYFKTLSSAEYVEVRGDKTGLNRNYAVVVAEDTEIYLPIAELIDVKVELERLSKEKLKIQKEISLSDGKLSNEGFIKKAPEALVSAEKEKKEKYVVMLKKLEERIGELRDVQ